MYSHQKINALRRIVQGVTLLALVIGVLVGGFWLGNVKSTVESADPCDFGVACPNEPLEISINDFTGMVSAISNDVDFNAGPFELRMECRGQADVADCEHLERFRTDDKALIANIRGDDFTWDLEIGFRIFALWSLRAGDEEVFAFYLGCDHPKNTMGRCTANEKVIGLEWTQNTVSMVASDGVNYSDVLLASGLTATDTYIVSCQLLTPAYRCVDSEGNDVTLTNDTPSGDATSQEDNSITFEISDPDNEVLYMVSNLDLYFAQE